MQKIDVFDFDKTLYKKDSTITFYLYVLAKNKKIIKYFPGQLLSFFKYKFNIIDKVTFKERFFIFLRDIDSIDDYISDFWRHNKKHLRLDLLKKSKNKTIVISASPEFLLKNICKEMGIDKLIASLVDKKSGLFKSANCYGKEKLVRLNQEIKKYKIENFFSDSKSDIYLAEKASNSYLVKKSKIIAWCTSHK